MLCCHNVAQNFFIGEDSTPIPLTEEQRMSWFYKSGTGSMSTLQLNSPESKAVQSFFIGSSSETKDTLESSTQPSFEHQDSWLFRVRFHIL